MESARVRGCVAPTLSRGGKPKPVAGETAHVSRPSGRRSRCGLVVSPASDRTSDTSDSGRGSPWHQAATPQQAGVGTKTRSAGRTPSLNGPSVSLVPRATLPAARSTFSGVEAAGRPTGRLAESSAPALRSLVPRSLRSVALASRDDRRRFSVGPSVSLVPRAALPRTLPAPAPLSRPAPGGGGTDASRHEWRANPSHRNPLGGI